MWGGATTARRVTGRTVRCMRLLEGPPLVAPRACGATLNCRRGSFVNRTPAPLPTACRSIAREETQCGEDRRGDVARETRRREDGRMGHHRLPERCGLIAVNRCASR